MATSTCATRRSSFARPTARRSWSCRLRLRKLSRNVDEIAAVPGVDALFVGPGDLGLRLRLDPSQGTMEAAMNRQLRLVGVMARPGELRSEHRSIEAAAGSGRTAAGPRRRVSGDDARAAESIANFEATEREIP